MNKGKKYSLTLLGICIIGWLTVIALTVYVDPYFHYHYPNKNMDYKINNARYKNDGIMRHWDYNTMIIGTSMTENFKTSQVDEVFSKKSIKVPFAGASYKEIGDNISRAIDYNADLELVIRAIDYSFFWTDANHMAYLEEQFPTYLTNDTLYDDVQYWLNKDVFVNEVCSVLSTYQKDKGEVTSFDDAYNWHWWFLFGKEAVLENYDRVEKKQEIQTLTDEEIEKFRQNINQNLVAVVKDNPDVEFYYFFTPYSIFYWDDLNQKGSIEKHIMGERMIIEALLPYENVKLFSFSDNFELTTNLNNYKDIAHYGQYVNSDMLVWMKNGEYLLTESNYEDYLERIEKYYGSYNYESLFE